MNAFVQLARAAVLELEYQEYCDRWCNREREGGRWAGRSPLLDRSEWFDKMFGMRPSYDFSDGIRGKYA